jgi:hypothetical protein
MRPEGPKRVENGDLAPKGVDRPQWGDTECRVPSQKSIVGDSRASFFHLKVVEGGRPALSRRLRAVTRSGSRIRVSGPRSGGVAVLEAGRGHGAQSAVCWTAFGRKAEQDLHRRSACSMHSSATRSSCCCRWDTRKQRWQSSPASASDRYGALHGRLQ